MTETTVRPLEFSHLGAGFAELERKMREDLERCMGLPPELMGQGLNPFWRAEMARGIALGKKVLGR